VTDAKPVTDTTTVDLYKVAVEMADRISERRGRANAFFLTLNVALVAALGLAVPEVSCRSPHAANEVLSARWGTFVLALGGVAIALSWFLLLKSYRDLNKAKFKVIHEIEAGLPIRVFAREWEVLRPTAPDHWWRLWRRYAEFGVIERSVPLVFAAIYLSVVGFALAK
jgi:hypothetical protein